MFVIESELRATWPVDVAGSERSVFIVDEANSVKRERYTSYLVDRYRSKYPFTKMKIRPDRILTQVRNPFWDRRSEQGWP